MRNLKARPYKKWGTTVFAPAFKALGITKKEAGRLCGIHGTNFLFYCIGRSAPGADTVAVMEEKLGLKVPAPFTDASVAPPPPPVFIRHQGTLAMHKGHACLMFDRKVVEDALAAT